MTSRSHDHVSADRLQALLDGALPSRERVRVEEHVAACARCSEELEVWRGLFKDLSALPRHRPAAGFATQVLAHVQPVRQRPLAARLRARIASFLPAARPEHPGSERLQDFVDGALPPRQVARLAVHLDACKACAFEVDAWRAVHARLGKVGSFAPHEGFADRVMAAVRIPEAAASPAMPTRARPVGVRLADWRRALVAVGRFVPRTRRAWAALAGVAVTPSVTIGLLLYTVFSHPTLTPRALASFAVWKLGELAGAAWGAVSALSLDAGQMLGLDALVRALFEAPGVLAGGALAYALVSAAALRILYKNLSGQRRHARLSHS